MTHLIYGLTIVAPFLSVWDYKNLTNLVVFYFMGNINNPSESGQNQEKKKDGELFSFKIRVKLHSSQVKLNQTDN
jgi:hypothetical protein